MEQQSAAVCHGRERAIAATFLDEAAHALSAMELESPEALDEIFEKLPHIERHKCLGVICLKLEPGQAAVPAGLILSTAPEGVYQMVSIQCRDTKKDTKKGGKPTKSCEDCQSLFHRCNNRINEMIARERAQVQPRLHTEHKEASDDEVSVIPRITHASASDEEPEEQLICRGRERSIAEPILDETAVALAAKQRESPEQLIDIFTSLPHIDRRLCVGLIMQRKADTVIGLVLSTATDRVFSLLSLECEGTCKSASTLSCKPCGILFNRCSLLKGWKTDKVKTIKPIKPAPIATTHPARKPNQAEQSKPEPSTKLQGVPIPATKPAKKLIQSLPTKVRSTIPSVLIIPSASLYQQCVDIAKQKRSDACKRLQKLEDEYIATVAEWADKGHADIPVYLKASLKEELKEARDHATAALQRIADLVRHTKTSSLDETAPHVEHKKLPMQALPVLETVPCAGRVMEVSDGFIAEAERVKAEMEECEPLELGTLLQRVPHLAPEDCIGVVQDDKRHHALGLVLSTGEANTFCLLSIDCAGSMDAYPTRGDNSKAACAACQAFKKVCELKQKMPKQRVGKQVRPVAPAVSRKKPRLETAAADHPGKRLETSEARDRKKQARSAAPLASKTAAVADDDDDDDDVEDDDTAEKVSASVATESSRTAVPRGYMKVTAPRRGRLRDVPDESRKQSAGGAVMKQPAQPSARAPAEAGEVQPMRVNRAPKQPIKTVEALQRHVDELKELRESKVEEEARLKEALEQQKNALKRLRERNRPMA